MSEDSKEATTRITAMWVGPVSGLPWEKGIFGKCTNCNYINEHIETAPNFCEKCGAFMVNRTMGVR